MTGAQRQTRRGARVVRRWFRVRRVNRSFGGNLLMLLFLAALASIMALPLVYAVVNAVKPLEEFYRFPPRFYAVHPTVGNFLDLFDLATESWVPFSRYVFNSVFVSVITTAVYVVIAGMCGFVLAKHRFFGKKTLNQIIVVSLMFTYTVLTIPQYVVLAGLGLIDTPLAVMLPALGSTMGVFLLTQTMESFPDSVIESARLEGCGEPGICWRIVMPAVKPGWITVIIFTFQAVWNNTATNMIYTESRKMLPAMLTQMTQMSTLTQLASGSIGRAGVGAAASLLVMLPPIVVFVISQSKVLETMAHSGIKE